MFTVHRTYALRVATLLPVVIGLTSQVSLSQDDVDLFLNVNGDSLHYQLLGSDLGDAGPPLVLLGGGSGMDTRQWHRVTPSLAKDHTVILFDPRGLGKSENPSARYSDADDFIKLLDHLGVDQAIPVGLSSSGGLALEITFSYPDRVTGVIASAPFLPGFEFRGSMLQRLKTFSDAAMEGREPFLRAMVDEDDYFIPAPLDRSVRTYAREVMGENYDKGASFDESLVVMLDPPLIGRLQQIETPVLMPIGALDHQEVHRRNTWYTTQMPNSAEVSVPDAGHNIHLENPDGFLDSIEAFLESLR